MGTKQSINQICRLLGSEYHIKDFDLEKCIYRSFDNGFDIEISNIGLPSSKKPVNIYLWFGDRSQGYIIVRSMIGITRSAECISNAVESLWNYSQELLNLGYDTRDKLLYLRFPNLKPENFG